MISDRHDLPFAVNECKRQSTSRLADGFVLGHECGLGARCWFCSQSVGWKLRFSAWSCGVALGLAAYLRWNTFTTPSLG